MNVIFIHQNFPGQFRHIINRLASSPQNKIVATSQPQGPGLSDPLFSSVTKIVYKPHRAPARKGHPYLRLLERNVINGQAVVRILLSLRKKGFRPDLAVAHIGWGEALYFKDIFPDTPLVGYCEFYYHGNGVDLGFDPQFPSVFDDRCRVRTMNATQLLTFSSVDVAISPTQWQRSLYPPEFRNRIRVIHDGIDTERIRPDNGQQLMLPGGIALTKDMEVITYVARGLEPYRGFHIFIKATEEICRRRPNCHMVIVGGDQARYGKKLPEGQSYRQMLLKDVKIDHNRVHFLGIVPYETYLKVLQISSAHVYLTVPFVLSWSMLEAMAAGCVVLGSSTPPVMEVIRGGDNGLLFDFFSPTAIADLVDDVLDDANRKRYLGERARRFIVDNYEVKKKVSEYQELLSSL